MGLFSTQCANPECDGRVKKAARFCSVCGWDAPGAWGNCGNCGKSVGVESSTCWSCGHNMRPESRRAIQGGRWAKPPEVFAQREQVEDLQERVKQHGLVIEAGTGAVLLTGGKVVDTLRPGTHNLDSLARRINHWGSPPPRTVVLYDAGDFVLALRVPDLRTANDLAVEGYAEVVLRVDPARTGAMVENLVKTADQVSYDDLGQRLGGELRAVFDDTTATSSIEDLIKDPMRRLRLEDAIRETMAPSLASVGVDLVRVVGTDFLSPEYENLRAERGDLESQRQLFEVRQKTRELLRSQELEQLRSQEEFDAILRHSAQERGLEEAELAQEMERAHRAYAEENERARIDREMEKEQEAAAHRMGLEESWSEFRRREAAAEGGHRRAERVAEAETDVHVRSIEHDQAYREQRDGLTLKERESALQMERYQQVQEAKAARRRQESEAETQRLAQLAGFTPEQILAMDAKDSPEVARALAEIAGKEDVDVDKLLADRDHLNAEHRAQLERIVNQVLDVAKEAARRPDSPKSGGWS